MSASRTYALVTPVCNEADSLPRLARCIESQTVLPRRWVIVDTGSTDGTLELVEELARRHEWIELCVLPERHELHRGAPVVIAVHAGMDRLRGPDRFDVVVKLDADLSFADNYFERLVQAFDDPGLGIASGICREEENGVWVDRRIGGRSVWGASRAYRRECLKLVLPLEEHMGWDGIDQLKANMNGWDTRVLEDLPFQHHRPEGIRDGARATAWAIAGEGSYYMGYRFPFLVLRALNHARDELSALAMVWGYAAAALRRGPRCADDRVRAYLRDHQLLAVIPQRMWEALGRRS